MTLKSIIKYLKKDTWDSWLVSLVLIIIFIRLIFFPALTFLTGSPLPLVVVESCSMYHEAAFPEWWNKNSAFYENKGISLKDFKSFELQNGLNKGDIILVVKKEKYNLGDIIIFSSLSSKNPVIHRIIDQNPTGTKGDHNTRQLPFEKEIEPSSILGKTTLRIPMIGWIKLIFFEPFRAPEQRGFCR